MTGFGGGLGDEDSDEAHCEEDSELRRESERIAELIEELGVLAGAPVRERAEELVRRLIHLYGEGLRRLMGIFAARPLDEPTRAKLSADALLTSLLVLHDLHPDEDVATELDSGPDPAAASSGWAPIDLAPRGKRGGKA